jgi:F-type H+-transporting ATPase subunit delta
VPEEHKSLGEQQITNVYARALFEAARDAGTLDATGADLAAFTAAMRESKDLSAVLFNPRIDTGTKKKIMADITAGGDRIFINGINLLIDKRHSDLISDLGDQFQRLLRKEQKVIEVEVTSAIELPEETREKIRKRIEGATSMRVEIKETIREDIIGGLVLRFGDVIVDGSLKAKLSQLRGKLAQANIGSEDSFETAS